MKYFLITDTHLGHIKMVEEWKERPKGYEDKILKAVYKEVPEEVVLIHLGDVCFGEDRYWHEMYLRHAHDLRNVLVLGNHDGKSDSWYYDRGWDFVCRDFSIKILGFHILFSHKPEADCGYDLNIHGHFHNNEHRSLEPKMLAVKNDKQRLLAIESWQYKPVSLDEFLKKDISAREQVQNPKKGESINA